MECPTMAPLYDIPLTGFCENLCDILARSQNFLCHGAACIQCACFIINITYHFAPPVPLPEPVMTSLERRKENVIVS